jgi:hypothetical protein
LLIRFDDTFFFQITSALTKRPTKKFTTRREIEQEKGAFMNKRQLKRQMKELRAKQEKNIAELSRLQSKQVCLYLSHSHPSLIFNSDRMKKMRNKAKIIVAKKKSYKNNRRAKKR